MELLGTPIKNNLSDKHNQVNFKVPNKYQKIIYIINISCKAGFMSFANAFIA